jgi:hypothetical protein
MSAKATNIDHGGAPSDATDAGRTGTAGSLTNNLVYADASGQRKTIFKKRYKLGIDRPNAVADNGASEVGGIRFAVGWWSITAEEGVGAHD